MTALAAIGAGGIVGTLLVMKVVIKKFFDNEILSYLFFGVVITVVAVATRMLLYTLTSNEIIATIIGNIAGILFAFATNDTIVQSDRLAVDSPLDRHGLADLAARPHPRSRGGEGPPAAGVVPHDQALGAIGERSGLLIQNFQPILLHVFIR